MTGVWLKNSQTLFLLIIFVPIFYRYIIAIANETTYRKAEQKLLKASEKENKNAERKK